MTLNTHKCKRDRTETCGRRHKNAQIKNASKNQSLRKTYLKKTEKIGIRQKRQFRANDNFSMRQFRDSEGEVDVNRE